MNLANSRADSACEHPQTIRETIKWLLQVLKRPPLPECPVECERDCGVKDGKAPAFIKDGKASLVSWKAYQEDFPTAEEIKRWYGETRGIGTIGGWNGKHHIGFVDIDHKSFGSYEAFLDAFNSWMQSYPIVQSAPRFRSPSGGYRVILAFTEKPDWTAFSLVEDGNRVGELLARNGGHTLLPPTVGTNGKAYEWEQFSPYPPVVERPQDVGVYPTRKTHSASTERPIKQSSYVPGALRLEDLGRDFSQQILRGEDLEGDRSLSLAKAIHEWYGWENFCQRHNIPYSGTTEDLTAYAWSRLDDGKDPDKWERILKTVDPGSHTASEHVAGDDASCWKKIYRLDRGTFERKCPEFTRYQIRSEWQKVKEVTTTEQPQPEKPIEPIPAQPKSDSPNFHEVLDQVDLLEQTITDETELTWHLQNFAYENGLNSRGFSGAKLLQMARARRDGGASLEFEDAHEIIDDCDKPEWLINGMLLKGTVTVLSAAGGSGKTTMVYDFAKHIASGSKWSGYQTQKGKCLIVQTDEPKQNIAQKLRIARFKRDVPEGMVTFLRKWRFTQFRQLAQKIRDEEYSFVVIDSWTAAHAGTGVDLTKSNAGDNAYLLRDLAEDTNCTIVVLHHLNKINEMRDSSALRDNVSEVWRMVHGRKEDGIQPNQRILHIEKSRSDLLGSYLLEQNAVDYSWRHRGPLEDPDLDGADPLIVRIHEHLRNDEGRSYGPRDIAALMNCSYEKAELELQRLNRQGIVESEWVVWQRPTEGETGYFVYYYGDKKEVAKPITQSKNTVKSVSTEEDF